MTFLEELHQQRWDDHRYYHHNRINQTLHLISACCFLASYVLLFFNTATAVMVGWLLAMILRQTGHFFFEPRNYDDVNQATHEYKESIKVGYNLKRKIVLHAVWITAPVILLISHDFFGLLQAPDTISGFVHNTAILWLIVGVGALLLRTVHLFFLKGVQTGLVWFTKILTDPFHDIRIYYMAPYYIWKGEMYDDMTEWYQEVTLPSRA